MLTDLQGRQQGATRQQGGSSAYLQLLYHLQLRELDAPFAFFPVWSGMFRSRAILHFSIFQIHFVKFTPYIPLLKSQPHDKNLLFSSCIMRALGP